MKARHVISMLAACCSLYGCSSMPRATMMSDCSCPFVPDDAGASGRDVGLHDLPYDSALIIATINRGAIVRQTFPVEAELALSPDGDVVSYAVLPFDPRGVMFGGSVAPYIFMGSCFWRSEAPPNQFNVFLRGDDPNPATWLRVDFVPAFEGGDGSTCAFLVQGSPGVHLGESYAAFREYAEDHFRLPDGGS